MLAGALKNGPQRIGLSRGGRSSKINMVAANSEFAVAFSLSPINSSDAPEGRKLLKTIANIPQLQWSDVLMDRTYEGSETRNLAFTLRFNPVVPPHPNRCQSWLYNKELYKKRNEVERLFGYL